MKRYRLVPMTPPETGAGSDLLARLNDAQRQAASTTEGPLLVIAGAGTGKTRTLIHRTAFLVERGVPPEQILLLTFTRRAAEEMRQRAGLILDARCDRVQGGTFHATACGLLRRYGQAVGLDPAFTIMDRPDAEEVVGMVRADLGLAGKSRMFPKKKALLDIISRSVNRDVPIPETIDHDYPHFAEHVDQILHVAARYHAEKKARQLVDYDDLLTYMVELLENFPAETEQIAGLFRYIMVDEYQDTNRLQSRMVRRLAHGHDNVMAVGDDAQSIYAFRGACFRNIMDFPNDFPGAKVIKLTENYRSTPQVLAVANQVIAKATERYEKELTATCGDGDVPALICAPTENMQSRFLCQRIVELTEEGVELSNIAVLFRSAFHTFDLEVELARAGLPFIKRGGIKFMEAAHIKDAVSYLRVLYNPLDAISWGRVFKLHQGVGEVTARKLFAHVASGGDPWERLADLPAPWGTRLSELSHTLAPLARGDRTPEELLEPVISYYTPQLTATYDDHPKRARDLDQLSVLAARYEKLEAFLTDLALEPPEATVAGMEREERHEHLTLSTIHSAKGLEWDAVFVIWAVDGRFPSAYAEGSQEEMEEERRLMYVALTRARRHLAITYPINVYDRATGLILSRPSRLVEGISADILTPWALSDERTSPGGGGSRGAGDDGFDGGMDDDDSYFSQDASW